ncbi:MAG: SDR family oxidoreductase [Candidatus Poribacteria bacterium]|nr:SDR family oxidoreductase [Candidatus Poribacteria bacterium]MDE0505979.1 SDR family oxidoreductase [Candidatus Poribacteria bacterium]
MNLAGKKIIVIGGSSGIGLATAQAAAAEEAAVVIASRSQERLERARNRIHGDVQITTVDVRESASIQHLFDVVGDFDHLTTPGNEGALGRFLELDVEVARRGFDSKFWGQYQAVKYGAPKIREGGSIVLMAGAYSQHPEPGAVPQASINSAVEGLGRALAVELSPIRVNVVSPGLVDTPRFASLPGKQRIEMFQSAAKTLPAKRIAKAEDVAQTILYLMRNPHATGNVLYIDGGLTLR